MYTMLNKRYVIMSKNQNFPFWSTSTDEALNTLSSRLEGLNQKEVKDRLNEYGPNILKAKNDSTLILFINQFKNPIMLIMIIATIISIMTGDWIDSLIILLIVFASVLLSFFQEYSANNAVNDLKSKLQLNCQVIREAKESTISVAELVPGDIVKLSAGSLIPADGLILVCDDFYVNQSVLTGEALPVEKKIGILDVNVSIQERVNTVFTDTTVYSGSATILTIKTASSTEIGQIATQLSKQLPENEFERGIKQFGYLLSQIMLILTFIVFAINVLLNKPAIDSLLFSVALAVGITPQLLPAIINITLSRGAKTMAKAGVIVRHLTSIENFGSMDVLCTDKTGTITMGSVQLSQVLDSSGQTSDTVNLYAYLNAKLQIGLTNSMDQAIIDYKSFEINQFNKIDEIPYDFKRKCLSIIVESNQVCTMITKGAFDSIMHKSNHILVNNKIEKLDSTYYETLLSYYQAWGSQGYRVLGLGTKTVEPKKQYPLSDESDLTIIGFLLFFDPPKPDAKETIETLNQLGVQLKMITGDNQYVAKHTAQMVGLNIDRILTGHDLQNLSNEALYQVIDQVNLFCEVDPSQKEKIIDLLKKRNHVVGYMGDGINDAPALHNADVSISVDSAVDVAKEAASFVLMDKNLSVLKNGILLGRTTFANTLKYIYITTSANFGNMFSMAGASLIMPFLPLLPKQILLINFITDFPALTLSNDSVDEDMIIQPKRWDIRWIKNFMFIFGLISSFFDYLTFFVLLVLFKVDQSVFQSSWFTISIFTEIVVLLIMRTERAFSKSKPSKTLLYACLLVFIFTLLIPVLPLHELVDINQIPLPILSSLIGILILYILTTEFAKSIFYKKMRS